MSYRCPKGHESAESDFCSDCGARIADRTGGQPADAVPAGGEICPSCGAPRTSRDSNFCEVCGYNFVTKVAGGVPFADPPKPAPPKLAPADQPLEPPHAWVAVISVDPKLKMNGSPDPPPVFSPASIPLDKPLALIGRTSASRAIFPELALDFDDAVSHRHALITRGPGGELVLRDIGSSNGTQLNGKDVIPMTDYPLHDGDQLTMGHWTRIEIKAIA